MMGFGGAGQAQEWSRFRGPNGTGISTQTLPIKWTEKDYLWKVSIPGRGHSSPVAWQDHVYVTTCEEKAGKQRVLCLDVRTGKTVWQRDFEYAGYKMHKRNTSATSTPTVDSERVYLVWASPKNYSVIALDRLTGKDAWKVDLGPYIGNHGFGASLMMYDDLLILTNEQDKKGSSLLALDGKTGKKVWDIPRNSGNATYSTPCIYQPANQPASLIFTNWQHGITALEPRTGKLRWETSCFEPKKQERAIASPIISGDLVIGTCGFVSAQKHFVAVRPTNDGKVAEVWRIEKPVAYLPTPLVKDGKIYSCTENGLVFCTNAADGKIIWQDKLEGQFAASPVCAGNNLYCVNHDGDVYVLELGDAFKQLARNSLKEGVQATPAIVGRRLVIRTHDHLIAIGTK
jgi:outer membrane protein assembly factor BamB